MKQNKVYIYKDSSTYKKKICWLLGRSKRYRRKCVIKLKNKIKDFKYHNGGNFFSYDDFECPLSEIRTCTDIYFVSDKYPDILYTCSVTTVQHELYQLINDRAIRDTYALLSKEEHDDELENGMIFTPDKRNVYGTIETYKLDFRNKTYPQLDNKTVFDYIKYLEDEYWKNLPEDIQNMDTGYEFYLSSSKGITLNIVVYELLLTTTKLNEIIQTYLDNYEEKCIERLKLTPIRKNRLVYPDNNKHASHLKIITGSVDRYHLDLVMHAPI